jgi:hypothetical protein
MRSVTAWVLVAVPCAYVACSGKSVSIREDDGGSSARSGMGSGGNAGGAARGGSADPGEAGQGLAPGGGGGGEGGTGVGGVGGVAGASPGGDGGVGGSGGVGDGGVPGVPRVGECPNSRKYSTNLDLCEGGFVHRSEALACTRPSRGLGSGAPVIEGDPIIGDCMSDDDCPDAGYCLRSRHLQNYCRVVEYFCYSPCEVDADCPEGNLCACKQLARAPTNEPITLGFCSPATCSVDSDCPGGALCSGSLAPRDREINNERLPVASFRCQSIDDECFGADHCPDFPADQDNEDCREPSCQFDGSALSCVLTPTCSDDTCEYP